jgi:transcriptional regulator with AAA-type ATPase domain
MFNLSFQPHHPMPASLFEADDRPKAEALCRLTWCNPFLDERDALERQALGEAWQTPPADDMAWDGGLPIPAANPNTEAFAPLAKRLVNEARERLRRRPPTEHERETYRDLVVFALFYQFVDEFHRIIRQARERGAAPLRCAFYDRFRLEMERLCPPDQPALRIETPPERIFATFFQVRRAYAHIHECIIGSSAESRRLRARVWQSIFTRDMARFERALIGRMGDLITLITGPSGSGKELVARAIGLSRHVPFDVTRREFAEDYLRGFYPINLAALSPTLIESELFGHRRGSFTGALGDRLGYFEVCGPHGTVFLDEIGETDLGIQVKLLRVLQTRVFQRIGDTEARTFAGKIVTATNRDLAQEMRAGRFREDLYYRLCADQVSTPALREILRDSPGELATLVRHIAARVAGPAEAAALTEEACATLQRCLPPDYAWPGNFRELEQAVRNILVHGDYMPQPAGPTFAVSPNGQASGNGHHSPETLAAGLEAGEWTADELLHRYVTRVHHLSGSYEEAARRLGLDRRTVKKYLRTVAPVN